MASIKELPRWEDEVYQIARGDKVEGGVGGIGKVRISRSFLPKLTR
ncbi:hypothetical protein [Klebsiella pneumoniae]|nr:hypothetical protein [Klebsiella pneumoniae]